MKPIFLSLLFLMMMLNTPGWCCTVFQLKSSNGVSIGHSFDWYDGAGLVMLNKRGVHKEAIAGGITGHPPAIWKSKFGSVTIGWIAPELPTAGINEKGLLVAGLLADGLQYSTSGDQPVISSSQWKQYLLDTSANVEEALLAMKKLRIVSTSKFEQHFFLADPHGSVAVVEYLKGQPTIYTGHNLPSAILTNTLYGPATQQLNMDRKNSKVHATPSSYSDALNRMRKTDEAISNLSEESHGDSLQTVYQILEKVRRSNTQWQVVYDLENMILSWRTKKKSIHSISILDQNFSCGPPEVKPLFNPQELSFKPYDNETKRTYVSSANKILHLPQKNLDILENYHSTLSCTEKML